MSTYYERNTEKVKAKRLDRLANEEGYKQKELDQGNKWRAENRMKMREFQNNWMRDNPRYYFINNARARAKKAGVPFDLGIKYVNSLDMPDVCPYLGIPIYKGELGNTDNSPSLDRIKPHLGYVPGNVEFISSKANRKKGDFVLEEMEAFVNRLRELYDRSEAC